MNHVALTENRLVRCFCVLALCCALFAPAARAFAEEGATESGAGDTGTETYQSTGTQTTRTLPDDVTIIARVTAQPTAVDLSGDTPRFVFEASAEKTARDNVTDLCTRVLSEDELELTLAVSPTLLATWLQVDEGGKTTVHETLEKALATDRLEIVSLGYTDPGLTLLSDLDALAEIKPQYEMSANLPLEFADGTVPVDLSLPQGSAVLLSDAGLSWTVADASLVNPLSKEGTFGIYTAADERNLTILSADTDSSSLWTAEDPTGAMSMLTTFSNQHPGGAYVGIVDIGTGTRSASQLCANLVTIAKTNGDMVKTATALSEKGAARGVAPTLAQVENASSEVDETFIDNFKIANEQAESLKAALYSSSTTYDRIHLMLMLSECGAPLDEASRNRCCEEASNVTTDFFSNVHILIEPIVLASKTGDVPFTVINDTDAALQLTYSYEGQDGLSIPDGENDKQVIVYSGTNEMETPVSLTDDRGLFTVSLDAGGASITDETIEVSASNIDRITTVVCIVLVVAFIAAFLWHRRRKNAFEARKGEE